jgi:peptidyl-prolyl cis-trans isomerase A (cyclophilin A)
MRRFYTFPISFSLLLLAGCSREKPSTEAKPEPVVKKEEPAAAPVPTVFKVKFETTKGRFIVEAHREWAPRGVERFHALVKDGYFDDSRFFRVVPNFIIQFGLAGNPSMTAKWDKPIPDDPVIRTNREGSITFATAGPNTRTTQLFINLRSNQALDEQGFAPFGQVVEGLDVVLRLHSGYGERPDQGMITRRGNAYLESLFPNLDVIKKASIP